MTTKTRVPVGRRIQCYRRSLSSKFFSNHHPEKKWSDEKWPKNRLHTIMCAILNVDKDIISKTCKQIENKFNTIVAPANINSPKQIVISGTTIGVNQVVKHLTQSGYKKCIKLNVSVASHSRLMDEISKDFRKKQLLNGNIELPKSNNQIESLKELLVHNPADFSKEYFEPLNINDIQTYLSPLLYEANSIWFNHSNNYGLNNASYLSLIHI